MKQILIVEDEKPMAKALELKLNKSGFEATAVFDGEEALRILSEQSFDLILLDLIMPKRDGFGVLEGMKEQGIKAKVIITSNLSQESDIKRAKELGAVDFFVKSDTPLTRIVEIVKEYA